MRPQFIRITERAMCGCFNPLLIQEERSEKTFKGNKQRTTRTDTSDANQWITRLARRARLTSLESIDRSASISVEEQSPRWKWFGRDFTAYRKCLFRFRCLSVDLSVYLSLVNCFNDAEDGRPPCHLCCVSFCSWQVRIEVRDAEICSQSSIDWQMDRE